MAREVDRRKTGKALRRLKRAAERAAELAAAGSGPGLTDWEKDFVAGVSERLETYGSAFRDPAKGALDEALSQRQTQVVRALDKKGRPRTKSSDVSLEKVDNSDKAGKILKVAVTGETRPRSSFKRKAPKRTTRGRDINDDMPVAGASASEAPFDCPREPRRPTLTVIAGGKKR